jgi:hypothetical protein
MQEKPSQSKQKGLHFLGFLSPNWAFSMRYGQIKKSVSLATRVSGCASRPRTVAPSDTALAAAAWNQGTETITQN